MNFFRPNINKVGRLIRCVLGLAMLIAGVLLLQTSRVAAIVLFASAAFVLFEAARGWCVMRACGVKTKF